MKLKFVIPLAVTALMPLAAQAAPVVFSGTANDAAGLAPLVDDFRNALGTNNGNAPVNAGPEGFRSINWDAAPDAVSDPNAFPGDFFNADFAPRARGIEFKETGNTTGFLLSATEASGQPPAFGFERFLPTFSPERLFSPVDDTTFDVFFYDPANPKEQATTKGLGVVFSGLDFDDTASMSFFNLEGDLLFEQFAEGNDEDDLSFLGAIFDAPDVAYVSFAGGNRFLQSNGSFGGGNGDGFVMDDFIFGEPIPVAGGVAPVPLPLPAALLGFGLITLLGLRRRNTARA